MARVPWSAGFGIAGIIVAIVVLYTGINVQRSPFQAPVADAVPSRHRSLATGSVTLQMCVGAILFPMRGRALGITTWFALRGTERFGVRPEDVTIGFIAWAVGGVIGALPA